MAASGKARISPAKLALAVRRLRADKENLDLVASDPIAVIGMGCRFPGNANSPEEFWIALQQGRDGVSEVPAGRWKDDASLPLLIRRGGYVPDIDQFDAAYFGISPREAQQTDPQQRLLLEVTWEALWDAGIDPTSLAGTDAGVFAAIYNNDYARIHFRDTSCLTAHAGIGTAHSVAAGRLSFLLNLKGPSLAIDSACSSSLVATHLACQSLRNHECGLAIVGASSLKLLSDEVIVFSKWGMLAADGHCKTFDADADGFVPGEGSGAIILKRLSDALQDGDHIHAVIRGTAVNHDGRTTVLTAPNGLAQETVLRAALRNAMLQPEDISYIETHGTGTSLGDPIEIEAISSVYGDPGSGVPACVLGAVKTNLGHLEAAAGIAGIIKAVLCLEHDEIPKNLHFKKLNPEISLAGTRLAIPTENTPWARSEKPRAAGISSFGLGGTNAHVIVEESPLLSRHNAKRLPAHAWQRERFWLVEPAATKTDRKEDVPATAVAVHSIHPLLGTAMDSAFFHGKLFEANLNTASTPYLADHSLGDRALLPFAAFLEIATTAIRQLDKSEAGLIYDCTVREPLFLSATGSRLQVIAGDGAVQIASASDTGWTVHARASFRPVETRPQSVDLAGLRARCKKEFPADEVYRRLESTGLRYGRTFRTIQSVWSGERESVAYLRLSEAAGDARQYGLHPTLLDGCLQTVVAAREESSGDLFLSIAVDRFELLQMGVTELWAHTTIVNSSEQAFTADIVVMDKEGSVVARVMGLQAKRTTAIAVNPSATVAAAAAYELAWRPLPLAATMTPATATNSGSSTGQRWLFVASDEGSCDTLVHVLEQQGAICEIVHQRSENLPAALAKDDWSGIVYDSREADNHVEASSWAHTEKKDVEFILEFVKSLEASKAAVAPRLWIISSFVAAVLPSEDVFVTQAPLWGLVRTLQLEYPQVSPVLIDVGPSGLASSNNTANEQIVAEEIAADEGETLVAFRHGNRYVARFVGSVPRSEIPQRLQFDPSGLLENMRIEPATRRIPAPHEVEIAVRASGLNFRDVLTSLGMFAARTATPGAECSGTIVRVGSNVCDWKVGDDVLGFAPESLQTFVNVPADFVTRKPASMTFADAAGISVAFLTAHYGLDRLAKLSPGQTVLIHAAAGGLGLAAVQLAMRAGATVFATAGSEEKRAFLRKLGVEHVFDSRSLAFRDEVLQATAGRGVDVVLNSLAGDFIGAGFATIAEGGCFLEVGKRDIWAQEDVVALGKNIQYFPFDLGEVAMKDPELIAAMLRELMERFSAGELQPLPTALYSFEDAAQAFRTMAQARHIGKIVMGLEPAEALADLNDFLSDGTVLVTGGLGALGTELTRWLAAHGARHIVLASRNAADAENHPVVAELRRQGVHVALERADVASYEQMKGLLDRIRRTGPPLRCVFHAAGIVQDSVLGNESWSSYCETTAPKIHGAWNLDRLTQQDPIRLMVFFSSAASILGSPGQGSYAAGNAFLDALAHHRASRGSATLSVNWGAWASAGMAARLAPEQAARLARKGAKAMVPAAALATLQSAIESGRTQVAVMDMVWKQFFSVTPSRCDATFFSELQQVEPQPAEDQPKDAASSADNIVEVLRSAPASDHKFLLATHVKVCARRVLGLQETATIQDKVALQDVGLDSLMALEMRNDLAQSLGIMLAAGLLFDYPSVEELTQHLLELLAPTLSPIGNVEIQEDVSNSTMELQDLSEEEAELLLVQELDRAGREKANA